MYQNVSENLNVNDISSIAITIKSFKSWNTFSMGVKACPEKNPHLIKASSQILNKSKMLNLSGWATLLLLNLSLHWIYRPKMTFLLWFWTGRWICKLNISTFLLAQTMPVSIKYQKYILRIKISGLTANNIKMGLSLVCMVGIYIENSW